MAADAVVDGEMARIPPSMLAQAEGSLPNGGSATEEAAPEHLARPVPGATSPDAGTGGTNPGGPAAG
jgi:hypothetical protein